MNGSNNHPEDMPGLLSLPEVLSVYPLKRSRFLELVKLGYLPQRVKVGMRRVAWRREDIEVVLRNGLPSTPIYLG